MVGKPRIQQIGDETFSGYPNAGTVGVTNTVGLDYFAIASQSGYVRIFSARELVVRGVLRAMGGKVNNIRFDHELLVIQKDDGRISIYRGVHKMRPITGDLRAFILQKYGQLEAEKIEELVPMYSFQP